MYLNKIKIQKQIKRQKKRIKKLKIRHDIRRYVITNLNYTNLNWSHVFVKLKMFIELKFYKFFIKKLRRISRRKKFRSFVYLCCNHCFSKKSKNSRMGKGKGKFKRFVYRNASLKPVFSFFRVSKKRVNRLVQFLNKKSKNNFYFYKCLKL